MKSYKINRVNSEGANQFRDSDLHSPVRQTATKMPPYGTTEE